MIHSYVLMSNHYHLIVQTPEANLSACIQWLSVSYSIWFNKRHGRAGPLFQGRFKSIPVENSAWGYELSLYVHLNPVMRAGLGLEKKTRKSEARGYRKPTKEEVKARLQELRTYQWSSYRVYAGYCKSLDWLEIKDLLRRATRDPEKRSWKYRQDVMYRLAQGVSEPFQEKLKTGMALGTEKFLRKIRALCKAGRETSGKKVLRQRVDFDELVKSVEKLKKEKYDKITSMRNDWGKPLIMWGARMFCGMTLREIGDRIGNLDYGAVAMTIRRFEKKSKKDQFLRSKMKLLKKEMFNVKT